MMRISTTIMMIWTVTLVIGGTATAIAQTGADPNQPDTLMVDSSVAFLGGIGVVPISFFNDEDLSAVEVTLQHSCPHLAIDSFSFAGGRLDINGYFNFFQVYDSSTIITIVSLSGDSLVAPGRGLMGWLYFSYPQSIGVRVIPIDTVTWTISPMVEHGTNFRGVDALLDPFVPQYIRGYLDIQESPMVFDSVWIDDVDGQAGSRVAVSVYAFNERDLSKAALALTYGSDLLQFDSVSFLGTRGLTAISKTVQPYISSHKLYIVLEYHDAFPLSTGSGELAVLHFTAQPASPETLIVIDSTTVGVNSSTRFTLTPTDGSVNFTPLFSPGSVDIKISTGIEDITSDNLLPADYSLAQNYPNPFNPTTHIELSLPRTSHVQLDIFNILGRKVRQLINRSLPAGAHRVTFDGRADNGTMLASGVYLYRLVTDQYVDNKKMLLIK